MQHMQQSEHTLHTTVAAEFVSANTTTHLESFRNAVIVPADPAIHSVHDASSVVLDAELVKSILTVHCREVQVLSVCSVQCSAVLLISGVWLSAHDVKCSDDAIEGG
eukprot:1684-Heterococcus_DN1.PRE.2